MQLSFDLQFVPLVYYVGAFVAVLGAVKYFFRKRGF